MSYITILDELKEELKNEKRLFKYLLNEKRDISKRIRHHRELGVFVGDRRIVLLNEYRHRLSGVRRHRKMALKLHNKLKFCKALTGGEHLTAYPAPTIKRIPLTMENDFDEADRILESGDVTSNYLSENYFNERIENEFTGTYPITIERTTDYDKFIRVLLDDTLTINKNIDFSINFEEWKSGYKQDGTRQMKLNKYLKKQGFSQYTLDYYSQQIKTEKRLFLTISDRVQHITGMSFYSTEEWHGVGGTSCQDPRQEYEECKRLLPSLHDNKLLVAFLHDSLDDLEQMDGKMLARTVCRIVNVNGKQFLIGSNRYGNNETKDELEKALRQVNSFNVFSREQMEGGEMHFEDTNGSFYLDYHEEIYVCESFGDYVNCDCPACGGTGEYTVTTSNDSDVEITCPACGGVGHIEQYVSVDIDEFINIEDKQEIMPYNEDYYHYGDKIAIPLNYSVLGIR
ncbi:zinc finger-like domain-containing protein [Bacillus licheniformis]|uniref:zinc finger-like domain-containing protein n=1 Tax=Bacillus licheniformis TaxID=1402 RepID=UPI0020C853F1|nr:zinc finger-like domain-containing protein [Bacillus licheniformis]MCP8973137.1 zinc finger-like domain-containing protein [Bacillus licheniformis]